MTQVPIVLSVDCEFFQHAPAYRQATGTAPEEALGRRGIDFMLNVFDDLDAVGTFFIVSDIVENYPQLIERISDCGHEIASHTHTHRHLPELRPEVRQEEFEQSKRKLESVAGTEVEGFRAPSFKISDNHFDALASAGYSYDSSVVPCRSIPGWYGGVHDTFQPSPATAIDPSAPADLTEIPVAVMPGLRLPLTGTWIRFFGVSYTIAGIRLLARRGIVPVLYIHPWELVGIPNIQGVPRRIYFRSGAYMRSAVERILSEPFEFVTVADVAADSGIDSGLGRTDE
jgi:peptidoglycan/xylan/chitin deacetylase (PgdA/CDA1 family)